MAVSVCGRGVGEPAPECTFHHLLDFLEQNEDNTGRRTNNLDGLPPNPDKLVPPPLPSPPFLRTHNRCVKFWLKILCHWEKNFRELRQGYTFLTHAVCLLLLVLAL